MSIVTRISSRTDFSRHARIRREQAVRLEEERRRKERDRKNDDARDDLEGFAEVAIQATDAEIAAFTDQLDAYDAAVVEALHRNRVELERVQAEIDGMLAQAHVLPDGRRVFLTEDGTRVFDEHGVELGADDIDPMEIDLSNPRWETYRDARAERSRLVSEQEQLLDYQQQVDEARDRLDDDDLTSDELEELGAELDDAMPSAVRAALDGTDYARPDPAADAEPGTSAPAIDRESLARTLDGMPVMPR